MAAKKKAKKASKKARFEAATKAAKRADKEATKAFLSGLASAGKRKAKMVKPHKSLRGTCKHCKHMHSKSQHCSHGFGAFAKHHS